MNRLTDGHWADLKRWYAISCPRTGLRFDSRTLEFLDSDGDGRIRSEELSAALELVKTAGYAVESLFEPDESLAKALADNLARQDDLGKVEPTDEERQALANYRIIRQIIIRGSMSMGWTD